MAFKELSKNMFDLLLPNIVGAYVLLPGGEGQVRTINYYVPSYFEDCDFKYYILVSGVHLKRLGLEDTAIPFELNKFVLNNMVTVVAPATHDFIILCLTAKEKKDYFDSLCNYHYRVYNIVSKHGNYRFPYSFAQIDKDLFLVNGKKYVKAKDFDEAIKKIADEDSFTVEFIEDIPITDWEEYGVC